MHFVLSINLLMIIQHVATRGHFVNAAAEIKGKQKKTEGAETPTKQGNAVELKDVCKGFSFFYEFLLFIVVFIFIANPLGTHVLSRAAFKSGLKPWTGKEE